MGRWFFRFGEEVVPPTLRGFRLRWPSLPPPSSSRLRDFASPPPPGFVVSGINVRVRSIHDVDVVGCEEARMCGRDEGRAQQRGGPAHGSLLVVWGAASPLGCSAAPGVGRRALPCAVERCVPWRSGTAVPSRGSGPKGWRFASGSASFLRLRGLRRRSVVVCGALSTELAVRLVRYYARFYLSMARDETWTQLARPTTAHRSAGYSDDPQGPHASASRACASR